VLIKYKTTFRNEFNSCVPEGLTFDRKGYNAPLCHVLKWLRSEQFQRILNKGKEIVTDAKEPERKEEAIKSLYYDDEIDVEDDSTTDSVDVEWKPHWKSNPKIVGNKRSRKF